MQRSAIWACGWVISTLACSSGEVGEHVDQAVAQMQPTHGHETRGIVRFDSSSKGLSMSARIEGLSPGAHGMHVHEVGNCSAPDADSAGPHFEFERSGDSDKKADRIAGNLGELRADRDGRAELQATIEHAVLAGPRRIVGRSVVIHARGNDPSKPPGGDAGARVACGVIKGVGK